MSIALEEKVTIDSSTPEVDHESPWLGLEPFSEANSSYFFGRDREAAELVDRIFHQKLTIMYGQSGLGKTSLLQAGLIPRLRDGGLLPIRIRLVYEADAPPLLAQVVSEVERAILSASQSAETSSLPPSEEVDLWQLFHDPECGILESGIADRIVLILDQFEEVWTQGNEKRPEDAQEFMKGLSALIENRPTARLLHRMESDEDFADRLLMSASPVRVLLSLREDYLHWLERWRSHLPSMMTNRFELLTLSGPQALLAVEEPGKLRCRVDHSLPPIIERKTAEAIVRTVAGAPTDAPLSEIENVPPLLSLVCEQLNVKRLQLGASQITADFLKDSAANVLEDYYDRCFRKFPEEVQDFVEAELISDTGSRQLVTSDKAETTLRKAGLDDPREVLQRLVAMRLLTIEQRGGIARYELTHDVLGPIALKSRNERDSVRESLRREKEAVAQRIKRLQKIIISLVVVSLLGASFTGTWAWWQAKKLAELNRSSYEAANSQRIVIEKQKNQIADERNKSKELLSDAYLKNGLRILSDFNQGKVAPESVTLTGRSKWHEALCYLSESLEKDPDSVEAARALWLTLYNKGIVPARIPVALSQLEYPTDHFEICPSGSLLVEIHENQVFVKNVRNDNSFEGYTKDFGMPVVVAEISPQGDRILAGLSDGRIEVWNAVDGTPICSLPDAPRSSVCFSSDGSKLIMQVWDNEQGSLGRIYDIATERTSAETFPMLLKTNSQSFNPARDEFVNLASYGADEDSEYVVEMRDFNTGNLSRSFRAYLPHEDQVLNTVVLPKQDAVVFTHVDSEDTDKTIALKMIDFSKERTVDIFAGFRDAQKLAVSQNGDCFACATCLECQSGSCGPSGEESLPEVIPRETINWWFRDGENWIRNSVEVDGIPRTLFFGRDGKLLYVHCADNVLRSWNVASGELNREAIQEGVISATHCSAVPLLATKDQDGCIKVLTSNYVVPPAFTVVNESPVAPQFLETPHAFQSIATLIEVLKNPMSSSTNQAEIDLLVKFLSKLKQQQGTIFSKLNTTEEDSSVEVRVSQDFSHVVGKVDRTLICWQVATGGGVGVWKMGTDQELQELSSDGTKGLLVQKSLWETANPEISLLDFRTEKEFGPKAVEGIAETYELNPNGEQVLVFVSQNMSAGCSTGASGGPPYAVFEFNTAGQGIEQSWRVPKQIHIARYSPDGRLLLIVGNDNSLQIFDAKTHKPMSDVQWLDNRLASAWFNDESNLVYLAAGNEVLRWDFHGADTLAAQHFQEFSEKEVEWATQISGVNFQDDGELTLLPDSERLRIQTPEHEPWKWLHRKLFAQ